MRILNGVFEFELPYIHFLDSKTNILSRGFRLRDTLIIADIAKKVNFEHFFTFSCKTIAWIYTNPCYIHRSMYIGFPSIINMGNDTIIRVLAALQAEILQKAWIATKLGRPSFKMAPKANKRQYRFLNGICEIKLPYG